MDAAETRADPEEATPVLPNRHDRVVAECRRAVIVLVVDEAPPVRVEQIKTAGRAHPEPAATVAEDRANLIVGQAVRIARVALEMLAPPGRRIQAVQTAAMGADPHDPGIVYIDRSDSILAEARWILRVVQEARKCPALGIKQVETRVRTDPQPAAAVHVQNVDAVVAERGRIVRILAEMSELAGRDVQSIESRVARADPQRAVRSETKRANVTAGDISASHEPVERAVPLHETLAVGRDPEIPLGVFVDRPHEVAGKRPMGRRDRFCKR